MKNNIFFIGAGGIGMAALERYFISRGFNVAGYDLTPSALTDSLIAEGVNINFEGSVTSIPEDFRNPEDTLVVFTPAVPKTLPCFQWFQNNDFEIVKRAQLLGEITKGSYSICVAGTHGKTSTSSFTAHILKETPGVGCNAFIGGILRNYHSNFILTADSDISVLEADEYDRSFHTLHPDVAIITATDPDHLDIYGTEAEYLKSFSHFTSLIKPKGVLIQHYGLKYKPDVNSEVTIYNYTADEKDDADFKAMNVHRDGNHLKYDLKFPDGSIVCDFELSLPVLVNVENSVAAIAAIWVSGFFNESYVKKALLSYKGVERRFELRWEEKRPGKRVIIDDYAHHPNEIETSLKSIRQMYPDREITAVFQPHLYSRTRDFAKEFADALSLADRIVLADLYPARELPIPGISSETIGNHIKSRPVTMVKKENFPLFVKNCNFDVLVTIGAGDLPNFIPDAVKLLESTSAEP